MKLLNAALVIGTVLQVAATIAPASAATFTFVWSITGPAADLGGIPFPSTGTSTITAISTATPGVDLVTEITGSIDGNAIAGLTTFRGADDLIFPNASGTSFLDGNGISFDTIAGQDVNIFSFFSPGQQTTGNAYAEVAGGFGVGTFDLTPTPLPSTWTMLIVGFFGLGLIAYRGSKKASVGAAVA